MVCTGLASRHLQPEFLLVKLLHEQVHLATVCKEAVLNTSLADGGSVLCAETLSLAGEHSTPSPTTAGVPVGLCSMVGARISPFFDK